jgi:hypothetical protein
LAEWICDALTISDASAQVIELPVNILTPCNRPIVRFHLSSNSKPMSHCSAAADAAESYDDINLKVPSARETENWEAGQNPALPPQRWWSEAWRIKPLGRLVWEGAMGSWQQGRSRARKPALGTYGLLTAAGGRGIAFGRSQRPCMSSARLPVLRKDRQMDIGSKVLRQLKNHRTGFSLEQPFYTDPEDR